MMKRLPFPLVLLAAALLAPAGLCATDTTMKSAKTLPAKDALQCKPGEISACGLPSNVVIDMSKARVQLSDAEWRARLTP